jgi:hypothetical protein
MNYTLAQLIELYRTDPDSSFRDLQFQVRVKHERLLARIDREHGGQQLQGIRTRTLIAWHRAWTSDGKFPMARSLAAQLRALFRFGSTILEDRECERLFDGLEELRFQKSAPRTVRLTMDQAQAIRSVAKQHFGWPSLALAQALQVECRLRQKNVIGEIVPLSEPGISDVVFSDQKWLRGIRWQEVDDDLILRHITGKEQKTAEVDLKLAPMVLEELQWLAGDQSLIMVDEITKRVIVNRHLLPAIGPVVICDTTGLPWRAAEFRRKWRLVARRAGVPDNVTNGQRASVD